MAAKKTTQKRPTYVGPYYNDADLEPMGDKSAAELAGGQPDRVYDAERGRYVPAPKPEDGDKDSE